MVCNESLFGVLPYWAVADFATAVDAGNELIGRQWIK